jgi:hypothetical protein
MNGTDDMPDPNEILGQQNYTELQNSLEQAEEDLQTLYNLNLKITRYDAKLMVEAHSKALQGDIKSTMMMWQELGQIIERLEEQIEEDEQT